MWPDTIDLTSGRYFRGSPTMDNAWHSSYVVVVQPKMIPAAACSAIAAAGAMADVAEATDVGLPRDGGVVRGTGAETGAPPPGGCALGSISLLKDGRTEPTPLTADVGIIGGCEVATPARERLLRAAAVTVSSNGLPAPRPAAAAGGCRRGPPAADTAADAGLCDADAGVVGEGSPDGERSLLLLFDPLPLLLPLPLAPYSLIISCCWW